MRRGLFYGGFAAWVAVGLLTVTLGADPEPFGPEAAQTIFGDARSIASAAPDGLLALARVLERLGFEVRAHRRARPPQAHDAVLVLLGADALLSEDETETLFRWLREGGRFIYAGPRIQIRVAQEPDAELGLEPGPSGHEDAGEGESVPQVASDEGPLDDEILPLVDPVVTMLESNATPSSVHSGAAQMWEVGTGRVAVLPDGGAVLANHALGEHGLTAELPWLRLMLEDRSTVLFDEARLGFAAPEGLFDILFGSRFAVALKLGCLALLVAMVARGVRRMPAQPEPPAGVRTFAEHLDAVADALATGNRVHLASVTLLQGTRRRLAALSETPKVSSVLRNTQRELSRRPTFGCLVRSAERLRRLEAELAPRDGGAAKAIASHSANRDGR